MNQDQRIDPTPEEENHGLTADSAPETRPEPAVEETMHTPSAPSADTRTPEEMSPEEMSPKEMAPRETATEETLPPETVAESPAEPQAYRWTYADQAAHERHATTTRHRRGILLYSIIMTSVFLVSFGLLIAVLAINGNGSAPGGLIRPGINEPIDDEAVAGVEQAKQSVVVIEVRTPQGGGTGTGIIMTSDGYIATNHHVIEDATKIKVTFYDGAVMQAELVGSSAMDDLAVIKVKATGLPAATFGDSDQCYVGQTVYAIGTPASPEFGWTATKGIISYKNREVKMYDETDGSLLKKLRLLQTDATVNPGNSGGPLVNTKGEVVGVVSMKLSDGYEGIGFAIPSDGAVEILEAIMAYGNADSINSSLSHKRPMLGITGVYVNESIYYLPTQDGVKAIPESELDLYAKEELIHPSVSGIYVMSFSDGMNASAKMEVGDIITAAQSVELTSMSHLTSIINEYYAGDTVTLTVYRNGGYVAVDVILSPKPD